MTPHGASTDDELGPSDWCSQPWAPPYLNYHPNHQHSDHHRHQLDIKVWGWRPSKHGSWRWWRWWRCSNIRVMSAKIASPRLNYHCSLQRPPCPFNCIISLYTSMTVMMMMMMMTNQSFPFNCILSTSRVPSQLPQAPDFLNSSSKLLNPPLEMITQFYNYWILYPCLNDGFDFSSHRWHVQKQRLHQV